MCAKGVNKINVKVTAKEKKYTSITFSKSKVAQCWIHSWGRKWKEQSNYKSTFENNLVGGLDWPKRVMLLLQTANFVLCCSLIMTTSGLKERKSMEVLWWSNNKPALTSCRPKRSERQSATQKNTTQRSQIEVLLVPSINLLPKARRRKIWKVCKCKKILKKRKLWEALYERSYHR